MRGGGTKTIIKVTQVRMYLTFGVDAESQQHYVGLVVDAKADILLEWLNDNPNLSDTIVLQDIPTLRFPAPSNAHTAAVWVYSDLNLDRTRTSWQWGSGPAMMPPQSTNTHNTISMTVQDRPVYQCLGFDNTGAPQLDLLWCTGTPANKSLISATAVQITAMNPIFSGLKRKPSPTFASQNCHDDSHNHDEASPDDSPPPSPGPRKRRRGTC